MPKRPAPIPVSLAARPFTVAKAKAQGLSTSRLLGRDLNRPTKGVRSAKPVRTVLERATALHLVLPGGAMFSHQTAAHLLDLPLPRAMCDGPLHVATPDPGPILRRTGVVGHRGADRKWLITLLGLPVAGPGDTWLDLARLLSVDQLVQVGDAVVGNRPAAIRELDQIICRRANTRGLRRAREALALIRPGSRSPMETLCRLQMLSSGIPEPMLNADVLDEHGQWVACVDFCWRRQRVIVEYDGEQHADLRQREIDAQRRRQLTTLGWKVIVVTKRDVLRGAGEWLQELRTLLGR